jgi:hypothetical protein
MGAERPGATGSPGSFLAIQQVGWSFRLPSALRCLSNDLGDVGSQVAQGLLAALDRVVLLDRLVAQFLGGEDRSTRRCLDARGWVVPSSRANSVTGHSAARSSTRISRRCRSAIALTTSDVVAARAMAAITRP